MFACRDDLNLEFLPQVSGSLNDYVSVSQINQQHFVSLLTMVGSILMYATTLRETERQRGQELPEVSKYRDSPCYTTDTEERQRGQELPEVSQYRDSPCYTTDREAARPGVT